MIEMNYSVLMSIYKNENPDYFLKSVESMLNQTVFPEEIIIVEDGKLPDDLKKIITDYKERYPHVFTSVKIEENVGLGLALNRGLDVARNELIARMDTDDISLPIRCQLQLREFDKDRNLSIVGTNIDEFIENPSEIISTRKVPSTYEDILDFSKRRNPFNHPTIMYKKSVVLQNGGYADYKRNQDYDLFVRLLNNNVKAKNIDKSLVLYRANKNNFQRRKSWEKTSSNIVMLYNFYKKGYSGFIDFFVASSSHFVVFLMPSQVFKKFSNKFLRR